MTIPRVIATDLDGTFLNDRGRYDHRRFERLLVEMKQRGIRFVIATGDPLDHARSLFSGLANATELTYIVEDGALLALSDGTILTSYPMPTATWRAAVRWIQTAPVMADNFLIACGAATAYTELPSDSSRFQASRTFYPSLTSVARLSAVQDEILKLDVTWLRDDVAQQEADFNRVFTGELRATSSGLGGLNVSLPTVSKAAALSQLGSLWQIDPLEMAAFGDSGNDLALLQLVGQGLAVANAAPELLASSNSVSLLTNDQGAVMDQIESWLV
ncbi:HAD-IIB family hydrolase [Levilactobacillus fujinensis]|uniref:HAD-IIB family hydrolase n=1 Tax=Levilactobacillus fujinensis TaxID=2486024 RepID=A0ABW1TFX9_9LACO|nr:HAD-IIB family hydrolase [Levilactobacillus fujinensis]